MTKIYFVRHAQPIHSHNEDANRPLSEEGLRDRMILIDVLKYITFDYCISSPYKRAIDTISPLAETMNLHINTDDRFRERQSGNGNTKDLIMKRWSDFGFSEEGGENLSRVQERNIQGMKELLQNHAGETILFGTHGTALSCIQNYYDRSFGFEDFWRMIDFMPYVLLAEFEGDTLARKEEVFILKKEFKG